MQNPKENLLFQELIGSIQTIQSMSIPSNRKIVLQPLLDFIQNKINEKRPCRISFICTHNSRRSHLAQIWAQTMAHYHKVKNLQSYSGGTEATAMNTSVVETLQNSGFKIQSLSSGSNPIYSIKFAQNEHPMLGFSKIYTHEFNPKSDFIAVMTCDSANEACPMVIGAEQRTQIVYQDPKIFDGTMQRVEKYKETSLRIASEMYWVFSNIKS